MCASIPSHTSVETSGVGDIRLSPDTVDAFIESQFADGLYEVVR